MVQNHLQTDFDELKMYTISPKAIMKMFLKGVVTNKPTEEINWKDKKYLTHTKGRKRKTDLTNNMNQLKYVHNHTKSKWYRQPK